MNLNQLTSDFDNYMNAETDEEMAAALADLTAGQIEQKVEAYCWFFADKKGDIAKFKAQEERIAAGRKAIENKVERAKEYMKAALLSASINKVSAGTFKVSISPTVGKLVIDDLAEVPEQYKTKVEVETIDSETLKTDIKGGLVVAGAHIEPGTSLRIK